ncbi:hypothetical protein L484_025278 [Morus notabilis]|uniref:Uncharacterized protein n=1 Tax=Morus notabilis TaxID=981085 RepID=W9RU75_9ROSA|nr:hypothetical protein L484_025278 [Morus notabilis]
MSDKYGKNQQNPYLPLPAPPNQMSTRIPSLTGKGNKSQRRSRGEVGNVGNSELSKVRRRCVGNPSRREREEFECGIR